ncbi:MAG TPA: SRPBCC family protein, partial [Streptosporangiaceae bacterium]|nr:SRPBCC family protein [Streptosporangiaceae bacterium]
MAMEMDHSFTVPVSADRAWDVLLDVERIAPCMPGATVDEFDGEVVTGRIKVKVGPVSLTYRGTAKFTERDADAKHIVLDASGKETRGAGTASATVQASLEPESSGQATKVSMHTTMNVTGRPAQFGRGVMVEVGG